MDTSAPLRFKEPDEKKPTLEPRRVEHVSEVREQLRDFTNALGRPNSIDPTLTDDDMRTIDGLDEMCGNDRGSMLTVASEGRIRGFIAVEKRDTYVYIRAMLAPYENQEIVSALLAEALGYAEKIGVHHVAVPIAPGNKKMKEMLVARNYAYFKSEEDGGQVYVNL